MGVLDGEMEIEKYATPFKSPFPSKSGDDHPVPTPMASEHVECYEDNFLRICQILVPNLFVLHRDYECHLLVTLFDCP